MWNERKMLLQKQIKSKNKFKMLLTESPIQNTLTVRAVRRRLSPGINLLVARWFGKLPYYA